MKRTLSIVCPKCKGHGMIELPRELADTIRLVRRLGSASAVDVWRRMGKKYGYHPTAFNNRLNELVSLGYLTRTKIKKTWIYIPTEP